MIWALWFLCAVCGYVSCDVEKGGVHQMTIRMPDVTPDEENLTLVEDHLNIKTTLRDRPDDALICTAVKLGTQEAYILKFEPHATKTVAHHMMVYGCGMVANNNTSWTCDGGDADSEMSVCGKSRRQVVWAWANDADGRSFPKDVGLRVGGDTGINYLVVQLHYAHKFEARRTDNSGVTIHITKEKQRYQAGYYVLYTYGYIPAMTPEFHVEAACEFTNNYTMYPIGYRTHSHHLGKLTSGYRIRDGVWTEIGRMSPQLPQTFYNTTNSGLDIKRGDILASRCTMSSERNFITQFGAENKDEMCNFYIMYYTEYPGTLKSEFCARDAQTFHWQDYGLDAPALASSTEGLPPFEREDPYAD